MVTNVMRGISVEQFTSYFDGFKIGIVPLNQLERLVSVRGDTTQGIEELAEALANGDRSGQLRRPVGVIVGQRADRFELIFGFRRVRAMRHLGYQDCKAVIFDVQEIGRGKYVQEDFQTLTIVERHLLCDAVIRRYYADRVGLHEGAKLAIKQLGLGSRSSYGYGMRAIQDLDRRLLARFEAGEFPVSGAFAISQLPAEVQMRIASGEQPVPTYTELRHRPSARLRKSRTDTKVSPAAARVTGKTQGCVTLLSQIDDVASGVRALRAAIQKTGGDLGTHRLDLPDLTRKLELAGTLLSQVRVFVKGH